ncbi:nucleotidyltransferase domain-containing protein [Caenimonas sp. SL110]|uniref:nucleotidyltransferase domain-containing protein n=1 Tax=Caenimonas sp. SL110 TaxID=1450524 RepID=UPI0006548CCC|nr:nucleotidyltransferase domain-containing protein [Caenimonas sp. SL110]
MGNSTSGNQSPGVVSLASALFGSTQQRVLGLLFGQPDRSFYATELIALARAGSGAVQREVGRLVLSGLVTVRPVGNQKHYQANPASPIYEELCGIARKTVGIAEPLRASLAELEDQILAAFVFGSVAKQTDHAASDIDVMIISDSLGYADAVAALEPVAQGLGREINPVIYTPKELAKRVADDSVFVSRVLSQPKVWLFGSEHDLRI